MYMLNEHSCQSFWRTLIWIIPATTTLLTSLCKLLLHHCCKLIYGNVIGMWLWLLRRFPDMYKLCKFFEGFFFIAMLATLCLTFHNNARRYVGYTNASIHTDILESNLSVTARFNS